MVHNTKKQQISGTYQFARSGDLMTVVLHGKMTGSVIHRLNQQISRTAKAISREGGHPIAFIDASKIHFSDSVSSGRTEGRRMLADAPVERWAAYGTAPIGMLVDYIGRASGIGHKIRYFSDRHAAVAWLRGEVSQASPRSSIGLTVGITIALIGILGLIGWQTDNTYLMRLLPSLRPINPVAATGLVALGGAFFCYWMGALRPLRVLGWVGILLGISALLPFHIDYLLYGDAMRALGGHVEIADSAAICFILSGLLGLLANREGKWVQPAEYTFAGLMTIIATFNIYGQLYVHDFIYGLSGSFVMALNLAFGFLITGLGMIVLVLLRRTRSALQRVTRSGWLIVIALLFVQVATYASWAQAQDRNKTEAMGNFSSQASDINDQVNARLRVYVNALHGFRGLFAASDDVSQGDFEAYYSNLELNQFPGLRSVAFIAAVKTADLPTFAAKRRADTSLVKTGDPQFIIQKQSAEPLHFVATYIAGTPVSSSFGTDVTSIPGRSVIYNDALESNGYYSSGNITFAATGAQPASRGFFIATPVTTAKTTSPIGVVSTNFNYKDLFSAILASGTDKDLAISVTDSTDHEVIYTAGPNLTGGKLLHKTFTISLAQNQSWQVQVQAPADFGVTSNQTRLASVVLSFGQLFTILLVVIFVVQIRARGQALALADAVTEDLQIERDNIAALHKKDEAIITDIGEGLIVIDRNEKIEVTNAAAAHLLGYEEKEMIGKDVFSILHAIDEKGQPVPDEKRPLKQAMKQTKTITANLMYARKDGRQFPVKMNVSPLILRDELIGAVEVFSDVTHEKQLEHMKDEFLSVASHELRTPMGAIRANLAMILDGDYGKVNKGLVEPLSDMKSSTIRLVELVTDLLNVARIEAGRMHFELGNFDMVEAARSTVATLAPLGKEKGIHVSLEAVKGAIPTQADTDKVKQVLTNLIGNSLKFTDKGSITVTLHSANDMVEVSVTDTGIGISKEDRDKLFGKFNQITSAQAGKPAGTGLGLYISRQMIRKMGGDMWIQSSTPGKGSTFTFTLPRASTDPAKSAKLAVEQEAKLHPDQV